MTVVAPERIVASGGAPKKRSVLVAGLLLAAIVGGVIGFLAAPEAKPGGTWQRVGSLAELRTEEVLAVDGSGVILVLDGDNPLGLSALDGRGQPVTYCESSGWFDDRNHGSKFDRLGRYAVGPAPRGLDRFAVLVLGDDIYVDRRQVTPGPERYKPVAMEPIGAFCAEIRRDDD